MNRRKIIAILLLFFLGAHVHGQKLTLNTQQLEPGDPIVIKFSGAPGNQKDWIGLYPEAAPSDRSWLKWKYTSGKTSGEVTFSAPATPGRYNFRLFPNDTYQLLSTSSSFVVSNSSVSTNSALPVDIAGSWYGSSDQRGRLNFWQDGNTFSVIMSWPDGSGNWKTYKGDGHFDGRLMKFTAYPTSTKSTFNQGYIYYLTISEDNNEITGYYTHNGRKMDRADFHYYRVK